MPKPLTLYKKSVAAEETASLVANNGSNGSSTSSSSLSRWYRLIGIILAGCLALFLWDALEWDRSTGDVQLKLHTGSGSHNTSSSGDTVTLPSASDGTNEKESTTSSNQEDFEVKEAGATEEKKEEITNSPAEVVTAAPEPILTNPPETVVAATNAPEPIATSSPEPLTTAAPEVVTATPEDNTPVETASPLPPPDPATTATNTDTNTNTNDATPCQEACSALPNDNPNQFQKLTDAKVMLQQLEQYRQQWINQRLKVDYGEDHYYNIFEPLLDDGSNNRVNVGLHRAFVDPNRLPQGDNDYEQAQQADGPAWSRMVRKWTIKLLQLQVNMLQQQLDNNNNNQNPFCVEQCTANSDVNGGKTTTPLSSGLYGKYVWANGGHSASAGHGNFYRESYTANLERDLQPILKEIGLDFQVRNYAMGGTESGEEVALCFSSIFGKDIDSITYDFGMTDGHEYHKIIMYTYSAARLAFLNDTLSQPGNTRHRPSLLVIWHADDLHPVLKAFQNLGLNVLGMDQRFHNKKVLPAFPDMFGKTDAEIAALPPYVQYFKCQEKIEAGDPGCADQKFNMTLCPERTGRNTWHPGWRYHALMGHKMAFTVLEVMREALNGLIGLEPAEPETSEQKQARLMAHLQTLDAEEQNDYNNIFRTPFPEELKHYFDQSLWKGTQKEANQEAMKGIFDIETLLKEFSFCHTGILPAEIRYKGLLTENLDEIGTVVDEAYEHGILHSKIRAIETPPEPEKVATAYTDPRPGREGQMVITSSDKEYEFWCEEETMKDHKDFFYVSSEEGWRMISIPNNAEKEYYKEFNAATSRGWVFVCMANCDWDRCDNGDIRNNITDGTLNAGEFGRVQLEVNGVKVSGVKCFKRCCALQHDDPDPIQQFKWALNTEGKYEFKAMITGATKYAFARFSSFVLL